MTHINVNGQNTSSHSFNALAIGWLGWLYQS